MRRYFCSLRLIVVEQVSDSVCGTVSETASAQTERFAAGCCLMLLSAWQECGHVVSVITAANMCSH